MGGAHLPMENQRPGLADGRQPSACQQHIRLHAQAQACDSWEPADGKSPHALPLPTLWPPSCPCRTRHKVWCPNRLHAARPVVHKGEVGGVAKGHKQMGQRAQVQVELAARVPRRRHKRLCCRTRRPRAAGAGSGSPPSAACCRACICGPAAACHTAAVCSSHHRWWQRARQRAAAGSGDDDVSAAKMQT